MPNMRIRRRKKKERGHQNAEEKTSFIRDDAEESVMMTFSNFSPFFFKKGVCVILVNRTEGSPAGRPVSLSFSLIVDFVTFPSRRLLKQIYH